MKRIVLFSLILIVVTCSCHRKEFKSYTGKYDCIESIHTWEEGEPHYYENTTGHIIDVVRDKKLVKVLDLFFDIKSIEPNETYKKEISNTSYQSVRFSDNKIYYLEHTSVGGGGYEISYIGTKIEE